jgi:hypothetical protein
VGGTAVDACRDHLDRKGTFYLILIEHHPTDQAIWDIGVLAGQGSIQQQPDGGMRSLNRGTAPGKEH